MCHLNTINLFTTFGYCYDIADRFIFIYEVKISISTVNSEFAVHHSVIIHRIMNNLMDWEPFDITIHRVHGRKWKLLTLM